MSENLSVFRIDGDDVVIAKSRADAIAVWEEATSEDFEDYYAHWDVVPATGVISILFIEQELESTKYPSDGIIKELSGGRFTVEAPAESWAKCYGRGLLAGGEV